MFLNPRAPVANIALDKIQDPGTRDAIRNLIRTLEAIYSGVAQSANLNMGKLVSQPDQPEVLEGESLVWHDTDAPEGAPTAFILSRIGGQLFRFPTDQLSGGQGPDPDPVVVTVVSVLPASFSIDELTSRALTVNLSAVAPVGGVTISVGSQDGAVASVSPQQLFIAAGNASGTVTVTGNSPGVTSIVASFNNTSASSTVTVRDVVDPDPDPNFDFLQTFENIAYGNIGFPILQFDKNLVDGDPLFRYQIQCKDPANPETRVFQAAPGRHGGVSIVLRTAGADDQVSGSGSNERCDLNPTSGNPGATDGQEFWWAHSIFLPPGFIFAPTPPDTTFSRFHILMQLHDNAGQPPILLEIIRYRAFSLFPQVPMFRVRINGGEPESERLRVHLRDQQAVTDNSWYDLVWHIRWSQTNTGFCKMWMRKNNESIGKLEVNYINGPTKSAASVNFKPANYHSYVPGAGNNTDVYHDRIIRGHSAAQVSMFQLEGEPTF